MNKINTKNIVLAALLTAITIIIPIIFAPFRIVLGPYTATITAHVPTIIAMFINPAVAAFVALCSAIGFIFTASPVVAARAATHVIFAIIGAYMIKKNYNVWLVLVVTALVHALAETIVVYIAYKLGLVPGKWALSIYLGITLAGTLAHHSVDFLIAFLALKAIKTTKVI